MKWSLGLASLFLSLTAQAGDRVVRHATIRSGSETIENAEIWISDKAAQVRIPGKTDPIEVQLPPELRRQILHAADLSSNEYSQVAVPHRATGALKNATLDGFMLDITDIHRQTGSPNVTGAQAEISYPHQPIGAASETIRQRVPLEWLRNPYVLEKSELAVDLAEGPVAAKLIEISPRNQPGPRQAKVNVGGVEKTVLVQSLLFLDSRHPPTDAVLWRKAFKGSAGERLRREADSLINGRFEAARSELVGLKLRAIDDALPLWVERANNAKSVAEYQQILSEMPLPESSLADPRDRRIYERSTARAFQAYQITRDITLLRTLPKLTALGPSVDESVRLLGESAVSPAVLLLLKNQALSRMKSADDFWKIAGVRSPGRARANVPLQAEELEFIAAAAGPHFLAKGGTPDQLISHIVSLKIANGEYAPFFGRLMGPYLKAGGGIGGFAQLLRRMPPDERGDLVDAWGERVLTREPKPGFEEALGVLKVGLDEYPAVRFALKMLEWLEPTKRQFIDLVRATRNKTYNNRRDPGVWESDEMYRPSRLADILVEPFVGKFLAKDPTAAECLELGKQVGSVEAQLPLIRAALDRADSAREYLDAIKLLDPADTGARAVVRKLVKETYHSRFLPLSPTAAEVTELVWSPILRPDWATQEAWLTPVLRQVGTKKEFRDLRLPARAARSPEFQKVVQDVTSANPGWPRGWVGTICQGIGRMARPRFRKIQAAR